MGKKQTLQESKKNERRIRCTVAMRCHICLLEHDFLSPSSEMAGSGHCQERGDWRDRWFGLARQVVGLHSVFMVLLSPAHKMVLPISMLLCSGVGGC